MKTHAQGAWKRLIRAVGLAALLAAPAAAQADTLDETLEMSRDGRVTVENLAGRIEFETWERAEVEVRGETGRSVEDVEITSDVSGVRIRVINRKGERRIDGTDLHLRIPEQASIEAETVSADIRVRGTRGERVDLRTVSGDLEVSGEPGRMDLKSVSGDVEFDGRVSRSALETVSGEITVVGASGEVRANTVSGDVSLEAGEVSQGRFEAVSGDLVLELSLTEGGRLSCDSMSGDVRISLPGIQQAEFDAQTFSGSINSDFGSAARVSGGPGVTLEHREGDSGAKVRVETFSGDVTIRKH